MCIITYKDNTHWAKLANHGALGICVGYADGHPSDTCQVFNSKTKKIILFQDVIFLQKSYGEYNKVEKPVFVTMTYEGSDDEEELKTVPIFNSNYHYYYVVGDSDSDDENEENFFD